MLTWYNNLYIGHNAKRDVKRSVSRLNSRKPVVGIYLVTLASNEKNQLDIISAYYLLKPVLYRMCPMVVGIARGYDEAVELVTQITEDALSQTGEADMRNFLTQR